MSCILNIDRFVIPNDIVVMLCNIYQHIGKNANYRTTVGNDLAKVVEGTIERDAFFLAKMLKIELSETRMRLIITKDSAPRTREESILYNIKEILTIFQNKTANVQFQSNDIHNMINFVYKKMNIKFDYTDSGKRAVLQSQSNKSKRLILDECTQVLERTIHFNKYEKICLYLHYFIDLYNLKPFTDKNDSAAFLILYLLLFKSELECFKYNSFYEMLTSNFKEFNEELNKASVNWHEGYAHTFEFVRLICKMILKSYEDAEKMLKNYQYDKRLKKGENIENTILNMRDIFSKEDIRAFHPYVSESTINRALISLRDRGYIEPLGKGRSAKWIRKYKGYN